MTHWIRILGSILISLGILTLVSGVISGILFYVWILFQTEQYVMGVGIFGSSLIAGGFALRKIFKEPAQKI
jgi:ABC-type uncharacterized transport system permease subunit